MGGTRSASRVYETGRTVMRFIPTQECASVLEKEFGLGERAELVRSLMRQNVLPTFQTEAGRVVLYGDLLSLLPVIEGVKGDEAAVWFRDGLFQQSTVGRLQLTGGTEVLLPVSARTMDHAFPAALRGLMAVAQLGASGRQDRPVDMAYFSQSRLRTHSEELASYAGEQVARARRIADVRASQFANTAYYMGSKRALAGFLTETMAHVTPRNGTVVDLMCGSGAASAAFCRCWPTVASDAERFCTLLGLVQGGGFSRQKAEQLIETLLPVAGQHVDALVEMLGDFVAREDLLFHSDETEQLVADYKEFHERCPTYPNGGEVGPWDPVAEVRIRQKDPEAFPYCLFTTYFANTFFGLRQSIELDSLRYAVDQIQDALDRAWALGALVVTASAMATSYAGHFAQPPFSNLEDLDRYRVSRLLERRAFPITQEFCVRLVSLAEESERALHEVKTVPGPWRSALARCREMLSGRPVTVYLDAPYRREEYSRYYHVLETLVDYTYPSSVGKGRAPDKRKGERFSSEFFTRQQTRMERALADAIGGVLDTGWTCVWSYADAGDANIADVIRAVCSNRDCRVTSYATHHQHQSQGGRSPKEVTEYAVLFTPH